MKQKSEGRVRQKRERVQTTVRYSAELDEQLNEIARRGFRTKSEEIEYAISEHVKRHAPAELAAAQ